MLHGMTEKLIEIGRSYGKTKVMRITRLPTLITIMIDQKQLESVEYFVYLKIMMQEVHMKLKS
jgi:hypothetical protein